MLNYFKEKKMSEDVKCEICGKHPIVHIDYRFIDSCGLQGRVYVCKYCFNLDDVTVHQVFTKNIDPVDFHEES